MPLNIINVLLFIHFSIVFVLFYLHFCIIKCFVITLYK